MEKGVCEGDRGGAWEEPLWNLTARAFISTKYLRGTATHHQLHIRHTGPHIRQAHQHMRLHIRQAYRAYMYGLHAVDVLSSRQCIAS